MPAARGFFWSGRVLFLSGVVGFSSLGNAYGCTARAGFGRDFPGIGFGICLLLRILGWTLETLGVCSGAFWADGVFDWVPEVRLLNYEDGYLLKNHQKSEAEILKIQWFHFWGLNGDSVCSEVSDWALERVSGVLGVCLEICGRGWILELVFGGSRLGFERVVWLCVFGIWEFCSFWWERDFFILRGVPGSWHAPLSGGGRS